MINKGYKEFRFESIKDAKTKINQLKQHYGYTPSLFSEVNPKTKTKRYVVIKPDNLIRI